MKIGIDARLPAYQMGGISRYINQLVAALADLDATSDFVIYQNRKDRVDRVPPGSNFSRQNLWTPCHHRFERWLMSIELIGSGLDILHSPDFIPPVRGARRHVITVHDLNFLYYPQFLTTDSKRYYQDQIEWAVNRADFIIADSEHTRQDLINDLRVSPSRVQTIHLAADPIFAAVAATTDESTVQGTLRKHGLQAGFILFVGTIEPRKNLPTLLAAYDYLRRNTGFTNDLVIVGRKGWLYQEYLEALDSLHLQQHVRQIEGIGDVELAHLYLSAGLLALPSHYEGFGLPVLEAMHCGCPVIASNRASLPEVVGSAGILITPDDPEQWAAQMELILTDVDQRQQMISAGLLQAQRFSWARTARETWSVYERIA